MPKGMSLDGVGEASLLRVMRGCLIAAELAAVDITDEEVKGEMLKRLARAEECRDALASRISSGKPQVKKTRSP